MDIQTITALISTVGFPIVACCAMFWKVNKQDEQHKEEMEAVKKALESNTLAIQQLVEKLNNVNK